MTRLPTTLAAAKFAQHPGFDRPENTLLDDYKRWANPPPKDWKPTPWFPAPWNRNQLAAIDALPSMGFIHRPVFVKFEDDQGNPVTRRDARQKLLEAGWQQALQTLPEAQRAAGPARIIAAFNHDTEQKIALAGIVFISPPSKERREAQGARRKAQTSSSTSFSRRSTRTTTSHRQWPRYWAQTQTQTQFTNTTPHPTESPSQERLNHAQHHQARRRHLAWWQGPQRQCAACQGGRYSSGVRGGHLQLPHQRSQWLQDRQRVGAS